MRTLIRLVPLPSSLELAHILHVGCPVHVAVFLTLKPAPELLSVDLQEVCEEHFVENFTTTQHLVQCRTWSYVHQQLSTQISWRRWRRTRADYKVELFYILLPFSLWMLKFHVHYVISSLQGSSIWKYQFLELYFWLLHGLKRTIWNIKKAVWHSW